MAIKTLSASIALVMTVAACSAPSQPFLDQARIGCTQGDHSACQQVPSLQAQVNFEQQQQSERAAAVALGILGAAAAGAAAYSAARTPVYYTPVVVCRGWGCW
jgi:hypothetical protein